MIENDIKLYLKAKKQLAIEKNLTFICIFSCIVFLVLWSFNIKIPYLSSEFVLGLFVGLFIAKTSNMSSQLFSALERQVNTNDEAVKYVSKTIA